MKSSISRRWGALGLALALLALVSCGGGGGGGSSSPTTPPSKMFIVDGGNRAIPSFVNAAPTTSFPVDRLVEGTHTLLGPVPGDILSIPGIALDAASDRLYVATQGNTLIFDNISTADGDVAPTRIMGATIDTGTGNRGVNFAHIDIDTTHSVLYSVDFSGEAHVFNNPTTQAGASTVARIIKPDLGANTVATTFGLAIDVGRDMLYVGAAFSGFGSNIIVFNSASVAGTAPAPGGAPTTVTPVAPTRTLSFAQGVGSFYLDTGNDRLYASQNNGIVLVFDNASALTTGTPTANRTINLGATVQFYVFVDKSRNKLYAVTSNTAGQIGGLAIIDNASTANDPIPVNGAHFFTFSPIPNIALSAVAVAP